MANNKIIEYVTTSAVYRGATIHCTNLGNYIVEIAALTYKVVSLAAAKKVIDEFILARRN